MDEIELVALKESADKNKYLYDNINPSLLEKFPSPSSGVKILGNFLDMVVSIEVPEFTSLCPMTGQPDFATILIDYVPDEWCVESKSLKLYLMGFRNVGMFHEKCVTVISGNLITLLSPKYIKVVGKFAPRGGIPFHPLVEWRKDA